MRRYAVIEKSLGETPLQAMQAYQKSDAELVRMPLTYAGRLDPMAQGKLLVLIGDECKKRELYDGLDKEYVFEVLLGFTSDTGDVLGIPEASATVEVSERQVREAAKSLVGKHTFPYPAFSSKTVLGKPLFQYALAGTLGSIEIPTIDVRVYWLQYVDKITLSRARLIERILEKIEHLKVDGDREMPGADFRKEDICKKWWALQDQKYGSFTVLRFKATVSSGTYIRTLAPLLAQKLGSGGLAYSITRTKIGRYLPATSHFGFWTRTY